MSTLITQVYNPNAAPADWQYNSTELFANPNISFSAAVTWGKDPEDNDTLYIFGGSNYAESSGCVLARIGRVDLASGNWRGMEFWSLPTTASPRKPSVGGRPSQATSTGKDAAIGDGTQAAAEVVSGTWTPWPMDPTRLVPLHALATETTVQFHPYLNVWFKLYVNGFAGTEIILLWATVLTGPWSSPIHVYDIPAPFNDTSRIFCYAVKVHPEFARAPNEFVFTYATNGFNYEQDVLQNTFVYVPRFVRVKIIPQHQRGWQQRGGLAEPSVKLMATAIDDHIPRS